MDIPSTAVELPCGWLDKGKFDTSAQITPMTGLVRKLLARPDVRKNASKVIDTLLINCVQSVGPVTRMTAGNVGQLFLADRDFLTLAIRKASLGRYVTTLVVCSGCEEKIDIKFDLDEVKTIRLKDLKFHMVGDEATAVPAFNLEDAELKVKATFRYPTGKDQEAVAGIFRKNPIEANYKMYMRCLLEWNGEPVERVSPMLFDEQPLPVVDFIDKEFMAAQPGPDIRQATACPPVRGRHPVGDGNVGFFVPPPQDGEDLDDYYHIVSTNLHNQAWTICMTTQCISYEEVMGMPENERDWWYEKCEEYQDEQAEEVARAKAGH